MKSLHTLKVVIINLIITFFPLFATAQTINWQNTIGGTNDDKLWRAGPTLDGGTFCVGFSKSGIGGDKTENVIGAGFMDYWVMKLDASGNIEWQNTIGGSKDDFCLDGHATSDGGYILAGHSKSNISGDKTENTLGLFENNDMWIVKLNSTGGIEWQNTIGGLHIDYAEIIRETPDGGFVVAGNSYSGIGYDKTEALNGTPGFHNDVWVLKLSSTGSIIWQQNIGGDMDDYLSDMILTADGGFLIATESYSGVGFDKSQPIIGDFDNWLIKLDDVGNIQWEKTIGGNHNDFIGGIAQTIDGNYVVGGYSDSGISGNKSETNNGTDYWVYKIDTIGNIIWENTIGGFSTDFLYAISATEDNGVIVIGESNSGANMDKDEVSVGGSATDYWIIKINQTGGICWQETIGGNNNDIGRAIYEKSPGVFVAAGYSYSNATGDKSENNASGTTYPDYWIMEIDDDYIPGLELCNGYDDDCDGLVDEDINETISISAGGATTFCQGGSVVLSATHSATSLQWKKNGIIIPGAISSTYTANATGNYSCDTYSDCDTTTSEVIVVTVNKNPKATIYAGGPTSFCPGGSVTLNVMPVGGATYQWYKGASLIAGATSLTYVATTSGNYKCRVTKMATGCFKNSNAIAVIVSCKEGTSSIELENSNLELFPNPANEAITISLHAAADYVELFEVLDATGKTVFSFNLENNQSVLNISNLASGLYYIKSSSQLNALQTSFIKQ
ncbi:MAG: T9SS type A sorting domain-containing protein [Chitinophagales bacterium]|nr:T9SS type A sorting domain-containing protein [Chitinophagales bacterium]